MSCHPSIIFSRRNVGQFFLPHARFLIVFSRPRSMLGIMPRGALQGDCFCFCWHPATVFNSRGLFCIAHALLVTFDATRSCDGASRDDCQCRLLLTLIVFKIWGLIARRLIVFLIFCRFIPLSKGRMPRALPDVREERCLLTFWPGCHQV